MSLFADMSEAIADATAASSPRLVALGMRHGRHLTATVWRDDLVLASEQALPNRERFPARLSDGRETEAEVIGRDDGTNIAVLRLTQGTDLVEPEAGAARLGAFVLALGAQHDGGATAALGIFGRTGPAWTSAHGGRIDQYLRLDLALGQAEEGGPVLDASGRLVGVSVFGPHNEVLVIPHATLSRVVPQIEAKGRVARGWLGAGLQPVAAPGQSGDHPARGLLLVSVAETGPAAAAGLVPGDIIMKVGDEPVGRLSGLIRRLGPDSIGTEVELTLLHGGETIVRAVTVTERPDA